MTMGKSGSRGFNVSLLHRGICIAAALIACQLSTAQPVNQGADVEEILVTGERSLRSMRAELETAETLVFDLFNEVYADTEYEMICVIKRPVKGTFDPIPNPWTVRTCNSRYVHDLLEEEAADYADYYEGVGDFDETYFDEELTRHSEDLFGKVQELVQQNPEYRQRLLDYVKLKSSYEAAVEEDFAEGNFLTKLFDSED
jgi:hypothetical protein